MIASHPTIVNMASPIIVILGGLGTAYLFLAALLRFTQDPQEPPTLETTMLFLGPAIGLRSGMTKLFVKLKSVNVRTICPEA